MHPPLARATAAVPDWRLQIYICIAELLPQLSKASGFPEEFRWEATLQTSSAVLMGTQATAAPFLINLWSLFTSFLKLF